MKRLIIDVAGKGTAIAVMDDRNPRIGEAFLSTLPLVATATRWQEEIYFAIPLEMDDERPSPGSSKGDISYWSPGQAFCMFFGDSQPYSMVNHLGRIIIGLEIIAGTKSGDRISLRIEGKAED
jgi:hypothetical protein